MKKRIDPLLESLSTEALKDLMNSYCRQYNRMKTELIRRGVFENKIKRVSDKEMYGIISKSKTKKEAVQRCYPDVVHHGGQQYGRVTRMCDKYNIKLD